MKLGIFSHCTIDKIKIDENSYERTGGPACYCSLAARNMGFDVELGTRFGPDFAFDTTLRKNRIRFDDALSEKQTTRFILEIHGSERTLWLQNICSDIPYRIIDADGILVSPVFNEISNQTLGKIKKDANLVFVDPQGFLRRVDSSNRVFFERTDLDLTKVSVLKSDPNEIFCLTGATEIDGVKLLLKSGIEHLLYTNKRDVSMFYKGKRYSITLPNMDIYDTVGVGDIFTATFCCTLIREKDALWALSFAGGAAQAALESGLIGLDKVPPRGATETNAAYFYNTIKFSDI